MLGDGAVVWGWKSTNLGGFLRIALIIAASFWPGVDAGRCPSLNVRPAPAKSVVFPLIFDCSCSSVNLLLLYFSSIVRPGSSAGFRWDSWGWILVSGWTASQFHHRHSLLLHSNSSADYPTRPIDLLCHGGARPTQSLGVVGPLVAVGRSHSLADHGQVVRFRSPTPRGLLHLDIAPGPRDR